MKKSIFLAVCLFGLYSVGISQLSLRPQVGINFVNLSEDVLDGEWEGNVGYQFGIDLQLGSTIYIQPGLNFESTSLTLKNVGDLDVSRINIPVILGFRLFDHEENAFGIRGFIGPNFAINVNEDLGDAFQDITKDNIKSSQISTILGAGLDVGPVFLDVAYKLSLTDYFEDLIENTDARKHIFLANVGVRLGF